MQVIITESAAEVATLGADHICRLLTSNPAAVLGLATGSTPIALYQQLIERYQQGQVSFAGVRSFNLDEYIGLQPDHPQSYRSFMNRHLFDQLDIQPGNTQIPDGSKNPQSEALAYERLIQQQGGIDLQLLGVGCNGHIGFNEPSSSLASRTRVKTLTAQTVRDNSRFFAAGEYQPQLAITMGIATIMEARQLLLLATGEHKASAVNALVEGPLSGHCPASVLQQHPQALVIVDSAAGALLSQPDYFRRVRTETERMSLNHPV